jgi:hypothetical protein
MNTISDAELLDAYTMLKSTYKVAEKFKLTRYFVKERLKKLGVLRNQSQAAKERKTSNFNYKRTQSHRKFLSDFAKTRTGLKNPFYNKKHNLDTKKKLSELARSRFGKLNPNYKNKNYKKRPRDYKLSEFSSIRKQAFQRDDFKCKICEQKGKYLHPHHLIPFWICEDAFLDIDNIITVCKICHFEKAHLGNWQKINIDLINGDLLRKYSLHRERLNELTLLGCDSPTSNNK